MLEGNKMEECQTYEGIYSCKETLALPTRGAKIGCWKPVEVAATDAAMMKVVDFMMIMLQ
jgi:hypothetical protein